MPTERGEATRAALISAAIEIFARDGLVAASTRRIAEAAGVQQALIGFHFGGKEGLYLSAFESIVAQMARAFGPEADAIERELGDTGGSAARGLDALLRLVDQVVSFLVRDETAALSQLITREQQSPTRAYEIVHDRFFGRMIRLMTRLVSRVNPALTEDDARLSVVSIMGQMLVLRHSRQVVLRHLEWTTIDDRRVAVLQTKIRESITRQLSAPAAPRAASSTEKTPRGNDVTRAKRRASRRDP